MLTMIGHPKPISPVNHQQTFSGPLTKTNGRNSLWLERQKIEPDLMSRYVDKQMFQQIATWTLAIQFKGA